MSTKKPTFENTKMELAGEDRRDVCVSFGLRADDLKPEEISARLGLEPSHAFAKGDKYEGHINKNVKGIRKRPYGVWQIRSGDCVASSYPEDHARWLLGQLEPRASTVQEIMNRTGMYADVWVWIEMDGHTGSWTLEAETMSRLAKLCQYVNFTYRGTSEE